MEHANIGTNLVVIFEVLDQDARRG